MIVHLPSQDGNPENDINIWEEHPMEVMRRLFNEKLGITQEKPKECPHMVETIKMITKIKEETG